MTARSDGRPGTTVREQQSVVELTAFVLARVADDEQTKWFAAESEAKRIRIALLTAMFNNTTANLLSSYGYLLLCIEALPYAWHHEYREEWRP